MSKNIGNLGNFVNSKGAVVFVPDRDVYSISTFASGYMIKVDGQEVFIPKGAEKGFQKIELGPAQAERLRDFLNNHIEDPKRSQIASHWNTGYKDGYTQALREVMKHLEVDKNISPDDNTHIQVQIENIRLEFEERIRKQKKEAKT